MINVNKHMKKLLLITILSLALLLVPSTTFAQGLMGNWTSSPSSVTSDDHTAREEAEGKEVWEKLQAKQLACNDLTDKHYGSLGEYYMGQMMGNSHAAMNKMMENMMGKEGEEQMHIVVGKRLSGCQSDAQIPQSGVGFMPMMGFGILGWLPMLLFWIVLILGVVALFRYLSDSKKDLS